MTWPSNSELTEKIIDKAKSLGATMAGVAGVDSLKDSPSHRIYPKIGLNLTERRQDVKEGIEPSNIAWPADAVSLVVIGVRHSPEEPELDWWDGKGTPGNRILIGINRKLSEWIEDSYSIKTYKLPYFIEKGGIFLKDATVMAGLGCIGRNNLVITPAYGPRIRFRALLLNREAEPTGPFESDLCEGCRQPCRIACPAEAFQNIVYSADELGQSNLPGRNGSYDRVTCNRKMEKDIEDAVMAVPQDDGEHQVLRSAIDEFENGAMMKTEDERQSPVYVKYCRKCELDCPVGNDR